MPPCLPLQVVADTNDRMFRAAVKQWEENRFARCLVLHQRASPRPAACRTMKGDR
jgi:hypothetical protein